MTAVLAVAAVSAVAAEHDGPADDLSKLDPDVRLDDRDPAAGPFVNGGGVETFMEAVRDNADRAAQFKRRLASPESRSKRIESRTKFLGVADAVAVAVAEGEFGEQLRGARAPFALDEIAQGRQVREFLDDRTVVLAGQGDKPPLLVESPWPIRTLDDDGKKRMVDLSLEQTAEGFVPANAVADVQLPARLDGEEGIDVGSVSIVPEGAAEGQLAGGPSDRVIYPNAQMDTDVVITPIDTGVEVFWQLRSPRSPEELTLDLHLPEGALVQEAGDGSAVVQRDGKRLTAVRPPFAIDAQGADVPVTMAVRGDQLVLSVQHRDVDLAYPVLVDPIIEDYWGYPNRGAWFDQNEYALSRLNPDWAWQSVNIDWNAYAPRDDCYEAVSCDARIGHEDTYDYWKADGLHIYVRPVSEMTYPAHTIGQWLYLPPGVTTRIAELGLYSFYHRRGGSQNPVMFTGIYSYPMGNWVSVTPHTQDHAYHTLQYFAPNSPGPQAAAFGFHTPVTVGNGNWRDGYIGAAVLALTDPEVPTITGGTMKRLSDPENGDTPVWEAYDHATQFVKPQDQLSVTPHATDPGLGVKKVQITGNGISDHAESNCIGNKVLPCHPDWAAAFPGQDAALRFSVQNLPDGPNTVTLHAWDALGHQGGHSFPIKVDSTPPVITGQAGSLWDNRESDALQPEEQVVLSPGTHGISFAASDVGNGVTAAGVGRMEIRVDGSTEYEEVSPCPTGNCTRSLSWTYDTAKFGGRHKVELYVRDGADNVQQKVFYVNAPAPGDLLYPDDGEVTSDRVALQAQATDESFASVWFEYRRRPLGPWNLINSYLTDKDGNSVASSQSALSEPERKTPKLTWDVKSALASAVPPTTQIQVRAVFSRPDGSRFQSRVADVDLDSSGLTAGNDQASLGPGQVDLVTGNYTHSTTDAALSTFAGPIEIKRTFNSIDSGANPNGPYGPGWVISAPFGGVSDFSYLVVGVDPSAPHAVDVFDGEGKRIRFERIDETTFRSQTGFENFTLKRLVAPGESDRYTVTDLDGVVTTFTTLTNTTKFVPSKVEQPGDQGTASYSYEAYLGEPRLKRVVAPAPSGVNCDQPAVEATALPSSCRVLQFTYESLPGVGERLRSISQVASNGLAMTADMVAWFGYWPPETGEAGRLSHALDPRISPHLATTYNYSAIEYRLAKITPPGEAPWLITYGSELPNLHKVDAVSRTSATSGAETWRMRYGVPRAPAAGGPYDMSSAAVAAWGQTDLPIDATAIIPPTETGTGLSKATIHYFNQDGKTVNVARPGGRISVAEYDPKGNTIRELSAANRAIALAGGGGTTTTATRAGFLSTYRKFSANGLRLLEEIGPQHEIKLDAGQNALARARTVTTYDEGSTLAPPHKSPHLPTTVATGAQVDPSEPDQDVRVTKTEYDWQLRKPTRTIVDATSGGLNIARQVSYNSVGLEIEARQPKSNGADAGTTQTLYFTHDGSSPDPACRNRPEWSHLPCTIKSAAQPGTPTLPQLPVTTYTYDRYGNQTTATEQVGGTSRTVTTTYDAAGRKISESVSTSGGSSDSPSGLVAAYGFEEGSGSTVGDASGQGNDGEIDGATWTTAGKFGNALDFDGIDDSVAIVDDASIDVPTSVTASAWVKPHAIGPGHQTILVKERGIDTGTYALHASTGNTFPEFELRPGSWYDAKASSALTSNEWAHVAGSWDGQTIKLYINGTLVASRAMTGPILTSNGFLRIGGSDIFGFYFDGLIDEVRIYNRALSAQEIQTDKETSVAEQETVVGEPVPTTTYGYSTATGRPTTVSSPQGTITAAYDDIGRATNYTDAAGATSTTTYDNINRPVTTSDGKGTQTRSYDSQTGLLTSLTDSQAGTFTAAYDDDDRLISKTYPNGMTAATTYDEAGSPTRLVYTKTSNCASNCKWVDEQVSESVHGQWRTHSWELSSQEYTYDKAGRLTRVKDDVVSPSAVAGCTIRSYEFDANSNRTSMNTKAPDGSGACQPAAAGTTKTYSYDDADRLTATGIQYDKFGRMTSIPTQHSGGGVLAYSYYVNDQVRMVSQDGASKTYVLDPVGRHHQTVASGGVTHTDTFHYQGTSDSPSWTSTSDAQGSEVAWERNIPGIDGDLAAIRTHDAQGDTIVLQLQNLHGDIIATASTDPNAVALTARFESDEFGNPRQQTERRYGYLGGKQRRTELASGVIQMGVRSYVPSLGRFTSVDPVAGGSASAYDYANADPVNGLDLDGRVAGCKTTIKKWKSKRKGRVRLNGKWNCPASAWPGNVVILKVTLTIEREVRGTLDQIFKGKFETVNHYVMKPPKSQHRDWGVRSVEECDPGYEYQVKIEVFAMLQSPTGIGGGTKNYSSRANAITRCRG